MERGARHAPRQACLVVAMAETKTLSLRVNTRELLSAAIEKLGLTRREFARKLGCHHTHLGRALNGAERLGPKTIGRSLRLVDAETAKKLVRAYLDEQEAQIYAEARVSRQRSKR